MQAKCGGSAQKSGAGFMVQIAAEAFFHPKDAGAGIVSSYEMLECEAGFTLRPLSLAGESRP